MATYPIKMLKDEEGKPFVPLINIDAIKELGGDSLMETIEGKLEVTNIIAGRQIDLDVDGNNITINNSSEGTKLINNLDTTTSGTGALDAAQGKVLKDSIPEVINNLTTIDSKKALSAHQGYILAGRSVPVGGGTGQVLMKSADDDYSLTWGDAADPNAIIGDGSIKKIVELTYNEYITLEEAGQLEDTTEYHISDMNEQGGTYITETEIQDMIKGNVVNGLTSTSTVNALSAAQGKVLNQKIDAIANYTSEEQEIGTWFGEPVYRTVYYRTGMSDKYNVTFELPANRDIVINYYGTVTLSSGYVFPIPGIGVGWDQTTEFHISDVISSYIIPKDSAWAANCLFVASSRGRDGVADGMMTQVVAVVEYTKTK